MMPPPEPDVETFNRLLEVRWGAGYVCATGLAMYGVGGIRHVHGVGGGVETFNRLLEVR